MTHRRRKKNSTGLLGLIAALAVLLVIAIIVAMRLPKPNNAPTQPDTTVPSEAETQTPTETQAPTGPLEGWQDIDGSRYYFATGAARTGWQHLDGQDYYFLPDGRMARGTVEINGVNHFFSSEGVPLLMVNPWNAVPEGYEPELVPLSERYAVEGMRVDASCYDSLLQMIDDCNQAMGGKTEACVISSYRSMEHQTNAYNNKVDRVMAANPGMSREEAKIEAAKVVAVPGTSEHQLGLAVDIIDTDLWALEEEQEDLAAQKWLMENCWRYGFLLRYPKGTTDSTGIIYEPWHYRYLGVDLATEIHHSGMTVEQYLESLSS